MSMVISIFVSYKNHGNFVFHAKGVFIKYLISWLSIYLLNILFIFMTRNFFGDYLAGIIALPINIVLSFFLMSKFVFRINKGSL